MNTEKTRFYHAQAAKLDLRRKWQSMAVWPVVYRYGERLRIEFEYPCGASRVDLYIPAISLAIEIDEPHHDRQQDEDIVRRKLIEEKLNSDFVRLKVKGRMESESLFDQVEELFKTIENRINTYNPAPWEIKKTSRHMTPSQPSKEQGYSEENLRKLSEANIPELVDDMISDLTALGLELSPDLGPVTPGNGELGFSVVMRDIKFSVSVRPNKLSKLLVTEYTAQALEKLGISLSEPRRGRVEYWRINEFDGRFEAERVKLQLMLYKEMLDQAERIPSGKP